MSTFGSSWGRCGHHLPITEGVGLSVYPTVWSVYPAVMGVYPAVMGVYPNVLGVYPIAMGMYPTVLGVYPIAMGVYPTEYMYPGVYRSFSIGCSYFKWLPLLQMCILPVSYLRNVGRSGGLSTFCCFLRNVGHLGELSASM